jgi:hypothetical protein
MARAGMAAMLGLAILSASAPARGQELGCCGDALDLRPRDPPNGPSESELQGLLAGGAALAAGSYIAGVMLARGEPHSTLAVDTIPVIGPLVSAAHNVTDSRTASVLTFLAGAQAMGIVIVAAAAGDLLQMRRMRIDINAGPNGCGASLTWRLP